MSSTFSSDQEEGPSRTWWSPSKRPNAYNDMGTRLHSTEKTLPTKQSSTITLSSFASAMGFKSKKRHAPLTVERRLPLDSGLKSPTTSDAGSSKRPSSKSISSNRSPVESVEPKTPSDGYREARQSLLTLSDVDPFAGVGRNTSAPSPFVTSDSKHLSLYSSPSINDPGSRRNKDSTILDHVSYTSSSQSQGDLSPTHMTFMSIPTSEVTFRKKLSTKKSAPNLPGKDQGEHKDALNSTRSLTTSDKDLLSHPDATSRPQSRARGMTDTGSNLRSGFFSNDRIPSRPSTAQRPSSAQKPHSQSLSPRAIQKQISTSRIGIASPPSAPPTHDLPDTPHSPLRYDSIDRADSASSSSLSFASSLPSTADISSPQPSNQRERKITDFPLSSRLDSALIPSPPLKKALSHQSLRKRGPPPLRSIPSPPDNTLPTSYPQLPIPPLPKLSKNSNGSSTSSLNETRNGPGSSKRRESSSSSSLPSRKRLFSGSSLCRPSTSQCTPSDGDSLSVISLLSETEIKSSSVLKSSSFWEENLIKKPETPMQDYKPKRIMSETEMAELEANVKSSWLPPDLTLSPMTVSSDAELDWLDTPTFSSPSTWSSGWQHSPPLRATSLMQRPAVSTNLPNRPAAQLSLPFSAENLPPSGIISLPPPPRPQRRTNSVLQAERTILKPPTISVPQRSRPKSSPDKSTRRKSLLRKPSFLEIDDETDKDAMGAPIDKYAEDSFIDFARESFDTVRSYE